MKPAAVAAFALAALALAAPAQEAEPKKEPPPPPAKHVNQVSPEAKACIDAIGKAMYSPVAAGLKRLEGTMTSTGKSGTEAVTVEFRGPSDLKVKDVEKVPTEGRKWLMAESVTATTVRVLLTESLGMASFLPGLDGGEYDAEVVPEGKGKALRITGWKEGVAVTEYLYSLNDDGLPSASKGTSGAAPGALNLANTFQYSRVGDRFVLARQVMTFLDNPAFDPMDQAYTWTDVGGLRILTSYELKDPMGGTTCTRWKDLTVNGKKVELPPEEKPPAPKEGEGK